MVAMSYSFMAFNFQNEGAIHVTTKQKTDTKLGAFSSRV